LYTGEGDLSFGLDPKSTEHTEPCRPLNCVLEQRGLADPRFAAKDEGAAATVPRGVKHRVDSRALNFAAEQHLPMSVTPPKGAN